MESNPNSSQLSRRSFLKTSGLVLAAGLTGAGYSAQNRQNPVTDVSRIFDGIALTDQYGEPFDPSLLLRDKTALLAFGYGGCPMCNQINKTIAETHQKLTAAGHDVPLVVVSVLPDQDNKSVQTRKENAENLFVNGVDLLPPARLKQLVQEREDEKAKEEKREPRKAEEIIGDISGFSEQSKKARRALLDAYDLFDRIGAMDASQRQRAFHHVMPADSEAAQTLQRRLAEISGTRAGINSRNPRQHTRYLTLLDRGQVVKPLADGSYITGPVGNSRTVPFEGVELDRKTEEFIASPELIIRESTRIVNTVDAIAKARKAEESKDR
ncbi:MAG: SCO family protein [Alphaproteobacteria bacterium]